MALKKNKSDIAESFRNLLKKADEMALEQKKDDFIENINFSDGVIKKTDKSNVDEFKSNNDRLGIKNIKRIPENPFKIRRKLKSDEYSSKRKELIIKLSIILNKQIHYWLQRELPKYSKLKLEKHIGSLLINLKKK